MINLQVKPAAMLPNLPLYISIVFLLTTFLTVFFFYKGIRNSPRFLGLFSLWLIVQGALSVAGIYADTESMPPRFLFSGTAVIIFLFVLFNSKGGKKIMDRSDLRLLTIIHIVRVPVELILHELFLHKTLPQIMTYEGHNFDVISGMTAPIVYYCAFVKKNVGRQTLLLWNVACLGLLLNVVVTAMLSIPYPFQKLGLEQPNIAVLYFPFVWLPFGIVVLVLAAHLISIRRLLVKGNGYLKRGSMRS